MGLFRKSNYQNLKENDCIKINDNKQKYTEVEEDIENVEKTIYDLNNSLNNMLKKIKDYYFEINNMSDIVVNNYILDIEEVVNNNEYYRFTIMNNDYETNNVSSIDLNCDTEFYDNIMILIKYNGNYQSIDISSFELFNIIKIKNIIKIIYDDLNLEKDDEKNKKIIEYASDIINKL